LNLEGSLIVRLRLPFTLVILLAGASCIGGPISDPPAADVPSGGTKQDAGGFPAHGEDAEPGASAADAASNDGRDAGTVGGGASDAAAPACGHDAGDGAVDADAGTAPDADAGVNDAEAGADAGDGGDTLRPLPPLPDAGLDGGLRDAEADAQTDAQTDGASLADGAAQPDAQIISSPCL
jgi:hypothetical protein